MNTKKWFVSLGVVVLVVFLLVGGASWVKNQVDTSGPSDSSTIEGQSIPDISQSGYIADLAGILGNEDTQLPLLKKLKDFDDSGKGQIAVLTVKSLGGLSVEEFAIRVAEKWKVGDVGVDDGILFVIATEERKVRIEVGRGASVTDAQAGQILDEVMVPKLKRGDWAGAVNDGVDAIIKLMSK